MTIVKCHTLDTGQTQPVAEFDTGNSELDALEAQFRVQALTSQDRSTDHVYYITTV